MLRPHLMNPYMIVTSISILSDRCQVALRIRAANDLLRDIIFSYHIRRLLENLNIEVLQLVRVAIGPLALGSLQKGAARLLTSDEKEAIDRAMR